MRNTVKRRKASNLTTQTLLDFDLGESSSDSDFRIEDHDDDSDDCSLGSKEDNDDGDDDDDEEEEDDDDDDDEDDDEGEDEEDEDDQVNKSVQQQLKAAQNGAARKAAGNADDEEPEEDANKVTSVLVPVSKATSEREAAIQKLLMKSICCACLGDRSDDQNEIVECDGCGVTVHEGCYGVSECTSVTSTISSCSTEPWFCDACRAGVENPDCELCPNKGGIFKETDVGKWVHLVCALYVPGVAFGEVDQLSSVTLFEMPYNKWGAKTCCLCEDARLARTGVCIGCDAGMCKTYFHVTCAQYYGLLSEAHSEEADQADPFYAHCKIHSDKSLIKHRKRNYNAIKMKAVQRQLEEESRREQKPTPEQVRIERKLTKHRRRYVANKEMKNPPWVPTQKMPRLLITSATACKKLLYKAELMGLDMAAIEFQEAQIASLSDVRKKWHIPPAFSVEFIGYYLDRAIRLVDMKKNLQEQIALNKHLLGKQQQLRVKYDRTVAKNQDALKLHETYKDAISKIYEHLNALCPNKALIPVDQIGKPPTVGAPPYGKPVHQSVVINATLSVTPPARTMSVPTAAALKMGVGFPLQNLMVPGKRDDTGRILSTQCKQNSEDLLNECGICKRCNDQHLLAKCDTCHLHYHLGCLNPPLTRHPKKSKLYGWQCSECDESDDSNPESIIIPKMPRKSRTRYSKDGTIVPYDYSFAEQAPTQPTTPPTQSDGVRKPIKVVNPVVLLSPTPTDIKQEGTMDVDASLVKIPSKRGRKKKSIDTPPMPDGGDEAQPVQADLKPTNATKEEQSDGQSSKQSVLDSTFSELDTSDEQQQQQVSKSEKVESTTVTQDSSPAGSSQHKTVPTNTSESTPTMNASWPAPAASSSEAVPATAASAVMPGPAIENTESFSSTHHKHSKRRKEKHRNRSPNTDRILSKDHKRKRKRKNHDYETVEQTDIDYGPLAEYGDSRPRIKIKIKSVLDGSNRHTTQIFYVRTESHTEESGSALPQLISGAADSSSHLNNSQLNTMVPASNQPIPFNGTEHSTQGRARIKRDVGSRLNASSTTTINSAIGAIGSSSSGPDECICDVCQGPGTSANIVQCDECQKSYHFGCLEPPLKKTPKRRGYSWHCADCDPTDVES
ncbi:PHD finger protein 14 [Anopheles maculipalpis]|uniref:PHD finger protein 14 n=1 Tax=Anopheles maculipalpis TaxID=1496333 RepID=UPI002159127A|nr:PHD finger protein 14 [Anopheles maculipalpis]